MSEGYLGQFPCNEQGHAQLSQVAWAKSRSAQGLIQPCLQSLPVDGVSTTSLGNVFQCLTALTLKDLFLISNLNLLSLSLKPFPLVLSPQTLVCPLLSYSSPLDTERPLSGHLGVFCVFLTSLRYVSLNLKL